MFKNVAQFSESGAAGIKEAKKINIKYYLKGRVVMLASGKQRKSESNKGRSGGAVGWRNI